MFIALLLFCFGVNLMLYRDIPVTSFNIVLVIGISMINTLVVFSIGKMVGLC